MISQLRTMKDLLWPRSLPSMVTRPVNSQSTGDQPLSCRVVHVVLALYLIPAVLVVFLVGALGVVVLKGVKILARLQGSITS
jgi:hypothetical protein